MFWHYWSKEVYYVIGGIGTSNIALTIAVQNWSFHNRFYTCPWTKFLFLRSFREFQPPWRESSKNWWDGNFAFYFLIIQTCVLSVSKIFAHLYVFKVKIVIFWRSRDFISFLSNKPAFFSKSEISICCRCSKYII